MTRIDAYITTRPIHPGLYEARVRRLTRPALADGEYPSEHVHVATFYGRTELFAFKSAERYALREYGRIVLDPLAPRERST